MSEPYDFREIEQRWQKYWKEHKTFQAKEADSSDSRPKYYVLEMFPYPSGAGLSVGHVKNYAPSDAYCRFKSMRGFNVLHPMGWDAFGQPAENEALKRKRNPKEMVSEYAANYRRTLQLIGSTYDWDREINSSDPDYYRWTQWIFLLLYKRGLAYRANAAINWCPSCKTGLANEEVEQGRCWRCGSLVEKRPMPQWYFKITAYADRLLNDLTDINWSDGVKQMQREWIGKSFGAEVQFQVSGSNSTITVFTTRPDTLWGATFMVLAPENPLVAEITTKDQREIVDSYIARAKSTSDMDRMNAERVKSGVFTGAYAINPVNGENIPIWIADYVLMGYGTGAIMAVPAHDQRDFEFARKFGLDVKLVYTTDPDQNVDTMSAAIPSGGTMVSFGPPEEFPFAGIVNDKSAVKKVIDWIEAKGIGKGSTQYKLRDWLISRQRYWGAPIPIVHCTKCGEVPVPEDQLPVRLPEVENYQPSGTGESPLATIESFVNTVCPLCGGAAKRETDTMGGFACSSWYFLRFADPHNSKAMASTEAMDYWLPVDMYTGGVEHAVMHLLYARFWTKVLFDEGLIHFTEPFKTLRNQGSMLAYTPGRKPRINEDGTSEDGDTVVDWVVLRPEELADFPKEEIIWRWARMSKSKGNVVTPEEICEKFGADSLRIYELFVAPFEDNVQWNEDGMNGAFRFINRYWRWATSALPYYDPNWRNLHVDLSETEIKVRRKLHQTIKKVTIDLDEFRFNTAIAAIMELVNDIYIYQPLDKAPNNIALLSELLEAVVLLISPIAPHVGEELWSRLGKTTSTYRSNWPTVDEKATIESVITVVLQVNGKVRDKMSAPAGTDTETLKSLALQHEKVVEALAGNKPKTVIVVPGKLVNVVV